MTSRTTPRLLFLGILLGCSTNPLSGQSAVVQECAETSSDREIPNRVTKALEQIGGARTSIAQVYQLCGDSTKWLAAVRLPDRDIGEERGWRLALLADSATFSVVRYATRGTIDSDAPTLRLFRSGVEYLLLAEEGDEGGTWGINTYDVGPFVIADLGRLDVGLPPDTNGDNDGGALSEANVLHRMDGWQVVFHRSVVLRPNRDDRAVLAPPRKGVLVFRPGGDWHLAK